MPSQYLKTSFMLSSISMLRMFGFFLLLPIMTFLASKLQYSTPVNIGLALGLYGLLQAIFYFPLGILSDKFGRKPIIYIGLIFLFIGAIMAANTDNIYILILARSIQGIGAISSVLSAYNADLIPEQYRSKSMMITGIGVGISFPLSLVAAPILYNKYGQSGIFNLIAILTFLALIIVSRLPKIKLYKENKKNIISTLHLIIKDKMLRPWLVGVVFLHLLSMMFFYIINFILTEKGINLARQWHFYLPIMLISFIVASKIISIYERKKKPLKHISYISITLLLLANFGLIFSQFIPLYWLYILATIYFTGFNLLEIFQPSILSKLAMANNRGAVMGCYYTMQSAGMFLGAIIGGYASKIAKFYTIDIAIVIFSSAVIFVLLWCLYSFLHDKKIGK